MWGRILIKAYTVKKKFYSQKGRKGDTHFHIGIYRIKSFKTFFVNNMRSEKLQDVNLQICFIHDPQWYGSVNMGG